MSKLNIKPLADRVVIIPLEAENKTASGIIIPDTAKKTSKRNSSSCGPGNKDESMTLKLVIQFFMEICWYRFKLDGTDYLIMRESDIIAIV
ncbi:MAG: 10 kDa chaperonin [Flavobacteriaceae bacterium]|nr:MAG: 10 kDa chaperonin [Flavobacteriaceae bacterium]